jgi:hypothetical protein
VPLSYTKVADVFQFRKNPDGSCCYTVTEGTSFGRDCTCATPGVTSVVPGNCKTTYEMLAERVILIPSFVLTKP